MTNLINMTQHAIVYGSILLIPAKPVKVPETVKELKEKYPALAKALDNGTLKAVTNAQAKEAEADLAKKTIEELTAYAASQGISLNGATKKDDILAAIQKAKA